MRSGCLPQTSQSIWTHDILLCQTAEILLAAIHKLFFFILYNLWCLCSLEIFVWETSQWTIDFTSWEFIPVESISQWQTTATVVEWEAVSYAIPITPSTVSDCAHNITVVSDDSTVADFSGWADVTAWTFYIYWASEWTTQIHYYLNSASETVYDIDVTVTVAP